MAHTLNEQVVVIPAGTGDANIELILDAAASLTGWYRDGYTLYCDNAHTMGVRFNWSAGSSSCRVDGFFNGNVTLDYVSSFAVSAGTTIRAHVSADESVQYINFGNQYLKFIHAVNSNGDDLLFQPKANDAVYCGTPVIEAAQTIYMPYNTTGTTYCITKMPDIINGSDTPSLFMAVGTASPSLNDQLVSFDGTVYRIVFLGESSNTSTLAFAFPVSA